MTAISAASAPAAPVVAGTHPQVLRWCELGFVFELACSDARIMEMAARIFTGIRDTGDAVADRRWTIEPSEKSREAALCHVEAELLEFVIANAKGSVAVHSALLSRNGKGILIVGPSFGGKSTLAISLWRAGWSLMSDDIAFVSASDCSAVPAPRRVSLRKESRELVDESLWHEIEQSPSCLRTAKGLFFHPHEIEGMQRVADTQINAVFFLARRGVTTGEAETSLINPAKGAIALLPYGLNVRELPFMDGLSRITPLADQIRFYDLGRGELNAMIAAVEARLV